MSLDEHTLRVVQRLLKLRTSDLPTFDDWYDGAKAEADAVSMTIENHIHRQRTRREKARRCEECRHYGSDGVCLRIECWCLAEEERNAPRGMCGRSGKLWEPK